jgi:hypothetical protein
MDSVDSSPEDHHLFPEYGVKPGFTLAIRKQKPTEIGGSMIVHVAMVTLVDRESGDKEVVVVGTFQDQGVAMIAAAGYAEPWADSQAISGNAFTVTTPVGRVISFANDNIHYGE